MDSALLSSRDGYPLETKSGLNGVKPPVEFGERTRDCSLGHAGKEGPHLAMRSSGFPYFLQFKSEFGNKEFMI